MTGDDKVGAILMVAFFIGAVGALIVGWPALACAAIAIVAIALSKGDAE